MYVVFLDPFFDVSWSGCMPATSLFWINLSGV